MSHFKFNFYTYLRWFKRFQRWVYVTCPTTLSGCLSNQGSFPSHSRVILGVGVGVGKARGEEEYRFLLHLWYHLIQISHNTYHKIYMCFVQCTVHLTLFHWTTLHLNELHFVALHYAPLLINVFHYTAVLCSGVLYKALHRKPVVIEACSVLCGVRWRKTVVGGDFLHTELQCNRNHMTVVFFRLSQCTSLLLTLNSNFFQTTKVKFINK